MSQVFLYLPFGNAEHPSQSIGGHASIGQEIDDPLTKRAFRGQHGSMVITQSTKSQMAGACLITLHLKSFTLNGCTAASILSKSIPALRLTSD
jgi:hypothetical protein